jgi:predicted RNase H-like nuclease (RuvC/YqgF family)
LASELNMYHSQVNEFKYEIERLNRELQDMKKKYYRLRKKQAERLKYETPIIEKSYTGKTFGDKLSEKLIKPNSNTGVRFSGDGFNLSTLPHHEFEGPAEIAPAVTEKPPTIPDLPKQKREPSSEVFVGIDDIMQEEIQL